jgi:tRNA A-37 threonylcarbamoyl transferase component Bud32
MAQGAKKTGVPLEIPGYRILRPIGAGGMGSVYEGEKETTQERFAIKFIREHLIGESVYYARFEREISAFRAIRHRNVVDVFEWHLPPPDSGDLPFVVMELVKGEALEALLRRTPKVAWPLSVSILLQVLDGLAAAHSVGVIHRDLGPSNILLTPEPNERVHVKLLDFGLARPLEEGESHPGVTQEGTWMGKPAYVAPELFRNQVLDARADIFACGMVLFRLLAGRFPYRETTSRLLWMERYSERDSPPAYPSVRTFAPDVPEELDRIVARSVTKQREERYDSVRRMQSDLLQFERRFAKEAPSVTVEPAAVRHEISGSSVIGGRSAPILMSRMRRIRPPVLAAGIVGLALVVALIIVLAGRKSPRPLDVAAAGGSPDALVLVATLPEDAGTSPGSAEAGDDAGASAKAAAEDAGAPEGAGTAGDAPAEAADGDVAGPAIARLTLKGVPTGAELRVDGRLAPQAGWVDVPVSTTAVRLAVSVPGGRYEPWVENVVPDGPRTLEVQLRRIRRGTGTQGQTTKQGDPQQGGIEGRFGTIFSSDYDDSP